MQVPKQRYSLTHCKLFKRMALPRVKFDSWRIVHYREGTDVKPLLSAQRGTSVKANVWWPSDQGLNLSPRKT